MSGVDFLFFLGRVAVWALKMPAPPWSNCGDGGIFAAKIFARTRNWVGRNRQFFTAPFSRFVSLTIAPSPLAWLVDLHHFLFTLFTVALRISRSVGYTGCGQYLIDLHLLERSIALLSKPASPRGRSARCVLRSGSRMFLEGCSLIDTLFYFYFINEVTAVRSKVEQNQLLSGV